jgi:hypothetical protein
MGLIGRWFKQIEVSGIRNPNNTPSTKDAEVGGQGVSPW